LAVRRQDFAGADDLNPALSLASFGWGVWTAKQTFEQLRLHAPPKPP
jgi:hypothetical protein